jgi:GNAT superfamily N-acetyltransferase
MRRVERNAALEKLRARLRATPGLRPVAAGEERASYLCDLASLTEGAFGEVPGVPATEIPAEQEIAWSKRLGGDLEWRTRAARYGDDLADRYWITVPGSSSQPGSEGTEIAGTIAVGTVVKGNSDAMIYSLYTDPRFRGRGLASNALDQVYEASVVSGLTGTRLDTFWVRQATIRFYLARRMWVSGWKHSICFARTEYLPPYEITESHETLTLSAHFGNGMRPLLTAINNGDRLGWREAETYTRLRNDRRQSTTAVYAQATLSLACALRSWPLVRSARHWQERFRHSDTGAPEGLAYKIGVFEQIARADGWRVNTPKTPGLPPGDSP